MFFQPTTNQLRCAWQDPKKPPKADATHCLFLAPDDALPVAVIDHSRPKRFRVGRWTLEASAPAEAREWVADIAAAHADRAAAVKAARAAARREVESALRRQASSSSSSSSSAPARDAAAGAPPMPRAPRPLLGSRTSSAMTAGELKAMVRQSRDRE